MHFIKEYVKANSIRIFRLFRLKVFLVFKNIFIGKASSRGFLTRGPFLEAPGNYRARLGSFVFHST